jgi:hypothetical protein
MTPAHAMLAAIWDRNRDSVSGNLGRTPRRRLTPDYRPCGTKPCSAEEPCSGSPDQPGLSLSPIRPPKPFPGYARILPDALRGAFKANPRAPGLRKRSQAPDKKDCRSFTMKNLQSSSPPDRTAPLPPGHGAISSLELRKTAAASLYKHNYFLRKANSIQRSATSGRWRTARR